MNTGTEDGHNGSQKQQLPLMPPRDRDRDAACRSHVDTWVTGPPKYVINICGNFWVTQYEDDI